MNAINVKQMNAQHFPLFMDTLLSNGSTLFLVIDIIQLMLSAYLGISQTDHNKQRLLYMHSIVYI